MNYLSLVLPSWTVCTLSNSIPGSHFRLTLNVGTLCDTHWKIHHSHVGLRVGGLHCRHLVVQNKSLHKIEVPKEKNLIVLVHQHGRHDVTCKPSISSPLRLDAVVSLKAGLFMFVFFVSLSQIYGCNSHDFQLYWRGKLYLFWRGRTVGLHWQDTCGADIY